MKVKWILLKVLPEWLVFYIKGVHYTRSLKSFDEDQEPDLKMVRKFIQSGDYVVDIGAHVGWYTKIFSELVGDAGKVFSIEPIPQTFKLLSHIIKKLRLNNVGILNFAISDKIGFAIMEVPIEKDGYENYYAARLLEYQPNSYNLGRRCKVNLITLDSLFYNLGKAIKFIKCDAEGHELSVIRGAGKMIAKDRPILLIEISGDPDAIGSPSNELLRHLMQFGYSPYWFDGSSLTLRSAGENSINYFFLTPDQLKFLEG